MVGSYSTREAAGAQLEVAPKWVLLEKSSEPGEEFHLRNTGVVKKAHILENENWRSLLSAARALRFVLSTTPPPRPPLYKADTLVVLPQDKYVRLF